MAYVTITTWEIADGVNQDVSLRNVREKRLPALRALGAERVTVIRTSPRTIAAISEWPDRATRDAAMAMVSEVRRKVAVEDAGRMTGEFAGEVVAEA